MFGNRVKGITVEIGGDVTKLDQALNKTDANLVRVQKDLKAIEKALKLDPTNVDLLAQKQRLLAEQADLARQRLSTMEQAAANLDDTISKSQLDAFNLELDLTKANAADAARQLEEFESPLSQISDAADSTAGELTKVGDSTGKMNEGFTISKGVMAGLAAGGFAFLADKALELLSTIWNLDEATEEYRESMALLNTAYEAAGFNQELAKEAYRGFYEILGDTGKATEAAQLLALLAQNEQDVARWVEIAAGVYGTFGESLPIESLIEATNETVKTKEVTGALGDALKRVGISEETVGEHLAELADETQRAQYLMGLLSQQYQDASASFYENNEAIIEARNAQAELDESLASIGQAVADVKTQFLETFGPSLELLADGAVWALGKVADVIKITGDAAFNLGKKIGELIKWFQQLFGIGDEASAVDMPDGVPQASGAQARSFAALFSPSPPDLDDFPHFASGGVFAPNNPMLGVLGDNPREVEIAAPRSAMQDAFLDALDQRSVGAASKFNVNIRFSGSLAQLGRLLQPVVTVETARQGPSFAR